jgi:hypothetical protein
VSLRKYFSDIPRLVSTNTDEVESWNMVDQLLVLLCLLICYYILCAFKHNHVLAAPAVTECPIIVSGKPALFYDSVASSPRSERANLSK